MEWYYWLVLAVIVGVVYIHYTTKWRREHLMEKYKNKEIVDLIMSKSFWQGQNEEQLIDSLGKPLDIDQKVLKTKTKEVWKYHQTAKNRYSLKITLENGLVVGWEQK
ncbi:hypothetical protein [Thiomicrorhabdus sp.]|uniref:hypothetical protein n=1 Tax=Thiomicrorhabdus sp. TaxID=2039724 RepID=UPI002AA8E76E|nr:hypothetical protein [Thiomicrorhabdus sp.]